MVQGYTVMGLMARKKIARESSAIPPTIMGSGFIILVLGSSCL